MANDKMTAQISSKDGATSNGLANSEAMSGAQSQHQRLSPISRQTGETGPLQPGRRNVKAIFNEMKGAYGQQRSRRELSARGIQTGKGSFINFSHALFATTASACVTRSQPRSAKGSGSAGPCRSAIGPKRCVVELD